MNSIERVNCTLDFKRPDRIPVHLWWLPATEWKYGTAFNTLLEKHPMDIVYVGRDNPEDNEMLFKAGAFTDIWGCGWENHNPGFCGQVRVHPLADSALISSFKPPLKEATVGFDGLNEKIEKEHRRGRFTIASPGMGIFHRMDFLRGTADLYMDLMDITGDTVRLRDMVFEYKMKELAGYLKTDIDGVQLNDDWGSQTSLLIPPRVWRDFMKPCYREYITAVRKAGKRMFFHSDGYIKEIYPDLIEIGVEAINSQVWCMGVEELGREFAGKITFNGEIDRQHILSGGTPENVRKAVRLMKKHLMTNNGGLIGQAEIGPDVPLETMEAALTAWNSEEGI